MKHIQRIALYLILIPLFVCNFLWAQNYAVQFDGVDDYIDLGANGPVLGNTFTQEFWIYPNTQTWTPPNQSSWPWHGLIGATGSSNFRPPSIYVYQQTRIHFGFGDGNANSWTTISHNTPSVLTLDSWNHVAITFDGTNYKVYVDGDLVDQHAKAQGKTPYNMSIKWIGQIGSFFKGQLDEVRIWNLARTQQQIVNSMDAELTGNETGLIAYYRMNASTGSTLSNSSPNGSDGTLNSSIRLVSTIPLDQISPVISSANLDTDNEFIDITMSEGVYRLLTSPLKLVENLRSLPI